MSSPQDNSVTPASATPRDGGDQEELHASLFVAHFGHVIKVGSSVHPESRVRTIAREASRLGLRYRRTLITSPFRDAAEAGGVALRLAAQRAAREKAPGGWYVVEDVEHIASFAQLLAGDAL